MGKRQGMRHARPAARSAGLCTRAEQAGRRRMRVYHLQSAAAGADEKGVPLPSGAGGALQLVPQLPCLVLYSRLELPLVRIEGPGGDLQPPGWAAAAAGRSCWAAPERVCRGVQAHAHCGAALPQAVYAPWHEQRQRVPGTRQLHKHGGSLARSSLPHVTALQAPLRPAAPPPLAPHHAQRLLLRRQQLAHAAGEVKLEPVLELDQPVQLILGLVGRGAEEGGPGGGGGGMG